MATINYTFPLKRSDQGAFALNDSTIEAVSDDLRILLLSNHGERPIHIDFGANLRSLVFDQSVGITEKAEDLILSAIEKWMPFVRILNITVEDSSSSTTVREHELKISLRFEVGQIEGALIQHIRN